MTTQDCRELSNATVVLQQHGAEHDKRDSETVARMYAQKVVREIRGSPFRKLLVMFGLADSKKVR